MFAIDSAGELPEDDAGEADGAQNRAESQAGTEFAPENALPVAESDFAESHRADDERGRLRARVAAA